MTVTTDETGKLVGGETPPVVAAKEADTAAAAKPERGDTAYVILAYSIDKDAAGKDVELWTVEEEAQEARSGELAVRKFAESMTDAEIAKGVVLVAVPARSWKPVRIKPQTVTTLVFEEA